jgi:hypothetical protein
VPYLCSSSSGGVLLSPTSPNTSSLTTPLDPREPTLNGLHHLAAASSASPFPHYLPEDASPSRLHYEDEDIDEDDDDDGEVSAEDMDMLPSPSSSSSSSHHHHHHRSHHHLQHPEDVYRTYQHDPRSSAAAAAAAASIYQQQQHQQQHLQPVKRGRGRRPKNAEAPLPAKRRREGRRL